MENYKEETYGERIAGVYDEWYSLIDPASVQVLAELAEGGKALELGIGTGRMALPLLEKGVAVHGLDASAAMVEKLKAKPGGEKIPVTLGNFADVEVDGEYDLVYVVFNTIFCLLTQEEQVRCFQNVARHLAPNGVFVLEAFVPDMTRFTANQGMRVGWIRENDAEIDISEVELDKQLITSQHMVLTPQGVKFYPVKVRYIWPAEMNLMAQLAGLKLQHRWGDWKKAPFTSRSTSHISVYERG